MAFLVLANLPYQRFVDKGVTIASDTTVLTGPIREDGGVDYLTAINDRLSEGITAENNAAALLFRLVPASEFGGSHGKNPILEREFSEALGYETIPVRVVLSDPELFMRARMNQNEDGEVGTAQIDIRLRTETALVKKPWLSKDLPLWAELLEQQREALDLAVAASKRPEYFHPLIAPSNQPEDLPMLMNSPLPISHQIRRCAEQLRFRAMNSLAKGKPADIEAAIEDIQAIRRLACLQSRSMVPIEKFIAIASFGIAVQAEETLLANNLMSESQLHDYQIFLVTHSCGIEAVQRIDEMDRLMALDQLQNYQIYGEKANSEFSPQATTEVQSAVIGFLLETADLAESMRTVNRWYDRYADALRQPTLRKQRDAIESLESEIRQLGVELAGLKHSGIRMIRGSRSRGQWIGDVHAIRWISSMKQIFEIEVRGMMQDQILEIAFAISRYHRSQGHFPVGLEQLVPDFLTKLPIDAINDTSYDYSIESDGFLLYSFGFDGVDNKGRNAYETESQHEFDIRICAGKKPKHESGSPMDKDMIIAGSEKK